MNIFLSPQRRDASLAIFKTGGILRINDEADFDFSPMKEGSTLPRSAIDSEWFAGDIEMRGGALNLTLFLPLPNNYSHAQAFPDPLLDVTDGLVVFPEPLSPQAERMLEDKAAEPSQKSSSHNPIDWSQLITAEMKAELAAQQYRMDMEREIARLRAMADYELVPLQDAVDIGEATDDERRALHAWKKYRIALNRISGQIGSSKDIVWPAMPV
ncbi:tail fiber assembly protein [Pseudomonas alliivorans]|nr:tail fiber assembly protein [Pseudomonas alliivorans]